MFNTYKGLHEVKKVLLRFLNKVAVNEWEACDVEPHFSADIYTTLKLRV
jgi:hypothetical protein